MRPLTRRFVRTSLAIFIVVSIIHMLYRVSHRDVVMAFKPTAALRKTDIDKTHAQMVVEAIRELVTQENIIPGVNKVSRSMQKAIDDIKWGDAWTDGWEYRAPEAHFTNDTFISGQQRLFNRYLNVKSALRQNKLEDARENLGQALHAIQDFYTHSNWVESGNVSLNPYLANFVDFLGLQMSSESGASCIDCDPPNCGFCIGNISTSRLTTAYFQDNPITGAKAAGKCSHGGPGDFSTDNSAMGGINKDTAHCTESPHSYLHLQAAGLAKLHTKEFIRFIRKNVTLKEFKALLGLGNTLGFAIDTTGSMSEEIAGVKLGANIIVDSRLGTAIEPSRYLLVEINDPYTIVDSDTDDPNAFKQAVNGLGAFGGGDCPELTFMAILEALGRFDEAGGELMVFTDATVKDGGSAGSVIALAQKKNVKITLMLSGSCSPIDPEYYRIARETGGQTFVISDTETLEATKLADFSVRPDSVDIAHINGVLSATPVTYTVPVDSTMTSVTLSASGATSTTITRPNGTTVSPTDSGVTPANISGGKVLSIANPSAGTWSVTVTGDGEFTIRVMGESPLRFSSFDIVELGGLTGHDGYFPISGYPIAGQLSKVSADVSSGNFSTAQFELRSTNGTLIQTLSLGELPNLEGDTSRQFFGEVSLPSTPVLAYVTGVDTNGQPYQRVMPTVIRPQTVQISAPRFKDIYPDRTFTFTTQITNYGASGTFKLDASDEEGFISYVSPSAFTLNTGATIEVTVTGQAPVNTAAGTTDTVTLSIESTGVSDAKNVALTDLNVRSEFELSPQSVHGGKGGSGTVRLFGGPAPEGGTVVTLESSNPSVAAVPAAITVPSGNHYESFAITTTTVATPTPVTITATYGAVSLTNVLLVVPAPDSLVSLELSPSIVKGGNSAKATINLNGPAPVGGATVAISSDLPAATVPASITIPEEASSATFIITTSSVTASATANISAVYNGLTRTASLKVNPTALESVSVEPSDVAGGISASVTVTLSAPAPAGGVQITFESGNTSIVTMPAQVTIPAGQSSATFQNSVTTTAPTVPTSVAVRAVYEGITVAGYVRVTPSFVPTNVL